MSYWAEQKPNEIALVDAETTRTWRELDRASNRLARAYAELGVERGSIAVLGLPNCVEFYEAAFALWKLGATPLPVSWRIPEIERNTMIEVAQPKIVIGVPDYRGANFVPVGFKPSPALSDAALDAPAPTYWKAMGSGGSTGRPKIIVSKEPGVFDPTTADFMMDVGGAILVCGPLYHNAGFMLASRGMFRGNKIVLMPKFDAERALALLEQHGITWVCLVPTMMQRIWKLPTENREKYDLSSLKIVLHTAAPCPPWLKENWIRWLGAKRIVEVYGGTEANGFTVITGEESLKRPGSVGRPRADCAVRVVDEDGRELPPGAIGAVFMRIEGGAENSYFYIGSEPTRSADGWESIGDLGYVDEEGYLFLADRRTDMIVSGGENVYPAEVEAAIDAFDGVRSSAVIGVPDDDLGNRVHAIVDAPDGIDLESLRMHLAQHLVRYKIPRSFEQVDTPLRDDAGKVRRSALREERLNAQRF